MTNKLPSAQKNYEFIDSLRFIAIITIVIEHSYMWPKGMYFDEITEQIIQAISMDLFKFGTITFYIIAGFLIEEKIHSTSSLGYLRNRFNNTFKPWAFWIFVFLGLTYLNFLRLLYTKGIDLPAFQDPINYLWNEIIHIVTETSFWFILNFLGSIAIILVFRKYLYNRFLGISLGLIALFYAVNVYYAWVPSRHTVAIFGFIFYLWLGITLRRNFEIFNNWIKEVSIWTLLLSTILTFVLSCAESIYMMNYFPTADPYNTLKITNVVYSLMAFLLLYKFGRIEWIDKLNPRSSTFGIHLVHYIVIVFVLPIIFFALSIGYESRSSMGYIYIQFLRFAITYGISYLVVFVINKIGSMKWMVGQ